MSNRIYIPNFKSLLGAIFLIALVVVLSIGFAVVSPAFGADPQETTGGDIKGVVTVNATGAAGLTVELRQRSNSGADVALASTTTDASGAYHFANQPSAPSDAFYYIHIAGANGTLAAWYSFPIIYLSGSEVTVPTIEMVDVEFIAPAQGKALSLPGALRWHPRKSGETYRVFVYEEGKAGASPVLDSGSLGAGTEFAIAQGALAEGNYEAVVQVRDAVVGYGQSQTRFHFTVGGSAALQPQPAGESATPAPAPEAAPDARGDSSAGEAASSPSSPAPGQLPAQPQAAPAAQADVKVNLSADKTAVAPGDSIVYKIEVENAGAAAAEGVVVTDQLPAGVTAESSGVKSTAGSVFVEGNTVTAQIGALAPQSKAVVEIPVKIGAEVGSSVSNQVSVRHGGAGDAVQSNAYIAQVAAPISGPPPQQGETSAPESLPAGKEASAPEVSGEAKSAPDTSGEVKSQVARPQAEQPSAPPASSQPAAQPQEKPSAPQASAPQEKPAAPQEQQSAAPQPQVKSATRSAPKEAPKESPQKAAPEKAAPQKSAQQPAARMPETGGSFPVAFALLLVTFTLLARYLRGRSYRRI